MKFGFVIWVALLAACRDHELTRLEGVRDTVCACKTVACADAALTKLPAKDVQTTPKSQGVAREMMNCLAEIYAADRPTTDPDAEPTAP